MIQIDDAGSGSLVGGTCIGVMRVETNEYYYDIIPLKYYSEENFKKKLYLEKASNIAKKFLQKLDVKKDEKILVCRGYMFDILRKWLDTEGYNWENTKILNPLQYKIEKSFEEYALSLGLPQRFLRYTKYPFHFHRLLRWVYADYDSRYKLCKTGWNSWKKYGNLNIFMSYSILNERKNYFCLKCGKNIYKGPVKVLKYFSNCSNTIYLHIDC